MKAVKFKKPTKVGIARTLNDAWCTKAGWNASKMVRGYGSPTSGWVCTQLENGDFKIEYKVSMGTYNGVDNVGLTDEERMERHERCTKIFINQLETYTKVLIAKGYNAYGFTKMVEAKIASGDFSNRTYKPCQEVEGFVTVKNEEAK
jgi:hypothetical protein